MNYSANGVSRMMLPKKILKDSVFRYQEMLDRTVMVAEAIQGEDTDAIRRVSSEIEEALRSIEESDRDLEFCLRNYPDLKDTELYRKRHELARESARLTKRLLDKLNSILVIRNQEIRKIAAGRMLTRHYHSNTDRKGRKISTTS